MKQARLGRTNLTVSRSGFGAIPIQRISFAEAERLLRKAYAGGITFFDTARGYTDSEEKIGAALSGLRQEVIIATKSRGRNRKKVLEEIATSLAKLKTGYVDLLQLHDPNPLPDPDDPESAYSGLLEARARGMTRYIGLTNHKLPLAMEAVQSGLYDTVQFPLSFLSSSQELDLARICREKDVGFIAMKALSGGLITNIAAAFAFIRQYDNVVPIWGMEREWQLNQFLSLESDPPALDSVMLKSIDKDREELSGSFCRACGYCLPCPESIPIPTAARMSLLLARTPYQKLISEEWKAKMELIDNCRDCGHCRANCPYELDTPALLRKMLAEYRAAYPKLRN